MSEKLFRTILLLVMDLITTDMEETFPASIGLNNRRKEELLDMLEAEASRHQIDYIFNSLKSNSDYEVIVNIALSEQGKAATRASWLLSVIDHSKPEMLDLHLKQFHDVFTKINNNSIKRTVFSVVSKRAIPEEYMGEFLNHAYEHFVDTKAPVAVRMYAMQIIADICEQEQELIPEFLQTLDALSLEASPGFLSRAKRVRKQLKFCKLSKK